MGYGGELMRKQYETKMMFDQVEFNRFLRQELQRWSYESNVDAKRGALAALLRVSEKFETLVRSESLNSEAEESNRRIRGRDE